MYNLNSDRELLGKEIVDAAYIVHKELGPGLLESVYESCFEIILSEKAIKFERQKSLEFDFHGFKIDKGLRLDFLIDNEIIVELKCVEQVLPVHQAQLLSYMKLANKKLGFLINFNTQLIKEGIYRRIL